MYRDGLGLRVIGSFVNHAGFDGVMLGFADAHYHLELTHCVSSPVEPAPTHEDLLVFYIPDEERWNETHRRMLAAGFKTVTSFNPFWDVRGRTYEDADGYRVVLQRAEWRAS